MASTRRANTIQEERRQEAKREIIMRLLAERHLHDFVTQAWEVIFPDEPFIDGWHIHAMCDHLEAVADGRIKQLLINIPPGTMKSLLLSVFFPAWTWTTRPSKKFMFASYSDYLTLRDSVRCRDLVTSPWYQARWPLELKDDSNSKGKWDNTRGGWRLATSIGGKGTGEHPDIKAFDDPHNVTQAESELEREAVIQWWDGTMETRGAMKDSASVGIMQRLHAQDLSGHLIEKGGWDHICLPMRYEAPEPVLDAAGKPTGEIRHRMNPTSIGWTDPRTVDGELLWPQAYDEYKVRGLEIKLGIYNAAGQLQQRPTPRGGGAFERSWFKTLTICPPLRRIVRYWDKAGCLIEGTKIQTAKGEKAIELVTAGDMVATRSGFKRVKWAGATGIKQTITSVIFDNGSILTGTPDHPVKTAKSNWVALGTISGEDKVLAWPTSETKASNQSYSKESTTQENLDAATSQRRDGTKKNGSTGATHSTEPSGEKPTETSPTACISTTRTKTGITTRFTIWNASREANTCCVIETNSPRTSTRRSLRASVLRLLKVISATKKAPDSKRTAASADSRRRRALRRNLECVLNVVAASNIEQLERRFIALEGAERGQDTRGAVVYDIEVEGKHEFYAEGILVHNTKGGHGAESAGVAIGEYEDPSATHEAMRIKYVILDAISFRQRAAEREQIIKQTAALDNKQWGFVETWVEQEPGSGGLESAENTVGNLAGFTCQIEKVTGSKEVRAQPLASQASVGKVAVLAGDWSRQFLDEIEQFPLGKLKDLVDAASGAFNKLFAPSGGFTSVEGFRVGLPKTITTDQPPTPEPAFVPARLEF